MVTASIQDGVVNLAAESADGLEGAEFAARSYRNGESVDDSQDGYENGDGDLHNK